MVKKTLLLTLLGFSLAISSFWVLRAQDPTTPKPQTTKPETQTPETTKMKPQTPATTSSQVDLSGTYAGTFNCEDAGLVGDTTLTITGNEFTTSDGRTGRIIASKSSGYTAVALQVNAADPRVTSSCLCKNLEGAGFPLQVKAMENGIDNSVHTFHIYKVNHRSCPSWDLHKATLYNIGSAQLLPQVFWETEKSQ